MDELFPGELALGALATARAVIARAPRLPAWLVGAVPVGALSALVAMLFLLDPLSGLRKGPPVEAVAVERTSLREGEIEMRLRNDGPNDVTIAQVLVNDAYWAHILSQRTLGRLEATTLTIPYPWEEGLPLHIVLMTSTGLTIEHQVEAAALTLRPDRGTIVTYALLGILIGVVPVAVGLLSFPVLQRSPPRAMAFVLAFTVGLLAFLLVDTVDAGIDVAADAADTLDGLALFAMGGLLAVVALTVLSGSLDRRRRRRRVEPDPDPSSGAVGAAGLISAFLVAAGIGLHNLGEGLAVGAAITAGELALGRSLVVGFALHNTTEGVAIAAPLGTMTDHLCLRHFVGLGALAGAPTIFGTWAGGFAFSPAWATLAFGMAAGAIAQVIWAVGRGLSTRGTLTTGIGGLGLMTGVLFMYFTGLLVP